MDRPDREALWKRSAIRRIAQGIAAMTAVLGLGSAGYVGLGWPAFDALYMVWITISGVGFGEVRPIASRDERLLTMAIIASGVVSVAYTVAGFIQLLTEGEITRLLGHTRMRRQIDALTKHIVVVGFGRVGELLSAELVASGTPFVVIEKDPARIAEIERRGFLCIVGDANDEATLSGAGIRRATAVVVVIATDAESLFITLSVREICPYVTIIARAEQPGTQKKLVQAGANHVILPAAIGAHRIASLLTNPSAVEFAELVTHSSSLALEMDDLPIRAGNSLVGRSIRDADLGRRTGIIVAAIKRANGQVEFPASPESPLNEGDSIFVMGRADDLKQFRREQFGT